MVLNTFKFFWPWSKVAFYLINLHIWTWSKNFERSQFCFWTSRWIRHKYLDFFFFFTFFIYSKGSWWSTCNQNSSNQTFWWTNPSQWWIQASMTTLLYKNETQPTEYRLLPEKKIFHKTPVVLWLWIVKKPSKFRLDFLCLNS